MLLFFIFISLCANGLAYIIDVDAQAKECFYIVGGARNTNVSFIYEVLEGGFLDIDVQIIRGEDIDTHPKQSSGKFVLPLNESEKLSICFDNAISTLTTKTVKFILEAHAPQEPLDPKTMESSIKQLDDQLLSVRREQDYIQTRLTLHHEINEHTKLRVTMWAYFNGVVMFAASVAQVFYLKKFFSVQYIV